jgi:hypothetical protein
MNRLLTTEKLRQEVDEIWTKTQAYEKGYQEGKEYQMSEPREPRFEDDFDCDTDPQEPMPPAWFETTIEDIAIMKSHIYAQEYDPHAGRVVQKGNYAEIKEAYKAGFLDGFTHRLTQLNTGE